MKFAESLEVIPRAIAENAGAKVKECVNLVNVTALKTLCNNLNFNESVE